MKVKAQLGNWSGIVGMGVQLIGPNGRVEARIALINHGEALRDRKTQERIAKIIVDAINSAEAIQPTAEPN